MYSDPSDGKVVGISDGDTFTLLTSENKQEKIRLHGIDCPEKKQDYGTKAKELLSSMVFGKQVKIERKDIDRYGRTVAIVYTNEGKCVNEMLLHEGLAWHYTKYDSNPEWMKIEEDARSKRVGLWEQTNPIPPWVWRKMQKTQRSME